MRNKVPSSHCDTYQPYKRICRICVLLIGIAAALPTHAFVTRPALTKHATLTLTPTRTITRGRTLHETSDTTTNAPAAATTTAKLGLLTFDLDDTLYPISLILNEANLVYARTMANFGYGDDIDRSKIVGMVKLIRKELTESDPEMAITVTHTQIRKMAIRRAMEEVVFERNLEEVAMDWGTEVESLTQTVVDNAKKWASTSVSESVIQAVLNAWEMERHHSAERHVYPEIIDVFKQIKAEHPDVIIGAVTDGKANPLLMTFTLAKYFDFCMNWEDDQSGRSRFFKELDDVKGNAELTWIYNAAVEKYESMAKIRQEAKREDSSETTKATSTSTTPREEKRIWIHVGDDLAYDVGGAAACGAKTIYCELDVERYGQTDRLRFTQDEESQPSWSTTTMKELEKRRVLNEAAKPHVSKTIKYLGRIPDCIDDILRDCERDDGFE